jgi:cytochrome P450
MRHWIIALLAATATFLAIESANSQAADHPAPASNATANRQESADDASRWQEPRGYKPCPAHVVFPNGRHACLGLPN